MALNRPRWDLLMPVIVAVALGMWWISGWALLTDYRPTMSGDGVSETAHPATVAWFRILAAALSGAGIALIVRSRGRRLRLVAAIVGAIAAGLAALMSRLVMWNQLALDTVGTGDDIRGLWWPLANSEQIRFLLIDGAEIGVGTYQRWLIVMIIAVVVASIALIVSMWPQTPDREPDRDPATVATGA